MPSFAVILPAAGKSTRFGDSQRKKPFVELKGRHVWLRAVEPFTNHDDVKQIIVVVSPEDKEWFEEKFQANIAFMNLEVVAGGKERVDSVRNGLKAVRKEIDFVAVHDAARPLITKTWVTDVFEAAIKSRAAILASKISSTVKKSKNGLIYQTVPRDDLWAAQTPQVFEKRLLEEAYAARGDLKPTDESQLIENMGKFVEIVECSSINMKITTKEDLRIAENLLNALPKEKSIGDIHPFAADNPHLFDKL